nr:hypothetical protein [Tanacetum cinerariifolium]
MTGDDNHDGDHPKTSNTTPPVPLLTQQIPHTVLSIKLPILKKRECDIWAMKMEHYLSHTDYPIWQVIQNSSGHVSVTTDINGMIKVLPPKTAEEMWEAINSRFGGNDESKKMQKYSLKQQFEDGEAIDWSGHVEEDTQNYAMMAYSSSNSGFDNETLIDDMDSKTSDYASCESDSSVEPSTFVHEPIVNESKVVSPIIEEYESDSDDDLVFNIQEDKEKPSCAFTESVKHVNTARKNIKEKGTPNHCLKIEKQDSHGHNRKDHKVNTVNSSLSAIQGNGDTAVKASAGRNPQHEVVNFLAGDLFYGNAKSKLLWLLLLQRDAYEKKLIHVLKIHTDDNVVDLLTKAFDVSRFKLLSKALASPKQTALSKDESNPLIVDSLLKYIVINAPCYNNEALAILEQTAAGVITPWFENMLVPAAEEVGQAQDDVSIPTEPSTSKPHKKHNSKKQQPIAPKVPSPESSTEHQLPSPSNDPIPNADKDSLKFQEFIDFCTRLSNKVLDLESEVIDIKSSFTYKNEKLEDRVHKLEEENKILKEKSFKSAKIDTSAPDIDEEEHAEVEEVLEVVTAAKLITEVVTTTEPTTTAAQVPKASSPRRRRDVVIQDLKKIAALVIVHTENDVIEQVKRSERQNNVMMRYQALNRKPLTEAQARKNMMIYLKNMAGFKMNFFKGMTYSEIRPPFEKHYNSNQAFLERVEEEEITKKQRMDKEAVELKRHLQIVANDDDDVYTEVTPLASKNFDREDFKTLWKLVKERFETTEPKNFLDDFLLNILRIMFEKPNIEANVWKDQKG